MYAPWLRAYPNVRIVRDQTYPLLQHSVAALVKSGTSTLETALLDVPRLSATPATAYPTTLPDYSSRYATFHWST